MKWGNFFKEANGTESSTRLITFIIVAVAMILSLSLGYMGLFMMWHPIILNGVLMPPATTIMDSLIMLVGALLSVGLGTKIFQKKYESGTIESIDVSKQPEGENK